MSSSLEDLRALLEAVRVDESALRAQHESVQRQVAELRALLSRLTEDLTRESRHIEQLAEHCLADLESVDRLAGENGPAAMREPLGRLRSHVSRVSGSANLMFGYLLDARRRLPPGPAHALETARE